MFLMLHFAKWPQNQFELETLSRLISSKRAADLPDDLKMECRFFDSQSVPHQSIPEVREASVTDRITPVLISLMLMKGQSILKSSFL